MTAATATRTASPEGYAEKIQSGSAFRTAANGHKSRMGYQAPITSYQYSDILTALGRMAGCGDRFAYAASQVIGKINLYGTRPQVCAAIYDALGEVVGKQYHDVIGATGPEAGRPSSHKHEWTVGQATLLYGWAAVLCEGMNDSVDAHGWALVALAEESNVILPRFRNAR